jgi:carbamoyl-phosphate synthase large subunit
VGIIGECNIQFGLDPLSEEYCAIEINARLSRSSALASKATGYPLAYMAAKLGLGYTLDELINKVTKKTTALFEPSLDYIVVKMPRWDFNKFEKVNTRLGTTMKSVGEVMAIGRTFEESIQKAIRMCDTGKIGIVSNYRSKLSGIEASKEETEDKKGEEKEKKEKVQEVIEDIEYSLLHPTDNILFDVARAIYFGLSIERINKLSSIDPWFLTKIKNIIEMENKLKDSSARIDANNIKTAKKLGFSDKQIAYYLNLNEIQLRHLR